MPKFTECFDSFACEGDTITTTKNGFDITARIVRDNVIHIDDDDCHNPDQKVTGCNAEQQKKLLAARDAWFNNDWFYCGIVLEVSKAGIMLDPHAASLWGIECNYPGTDNSYLLEVANDLLPEAVQAGRDALARLGVKTP